MTDAPPPSHEVILRMAEEALASIPPELLRHVTGLGIVVEEVAGPDLLARLGLHTPWSLLGVYQGIPLPRRSFTMIRISPDRIVLFRLPILRYWQVQGGTLEDIVRHVLIHEIGHHFGFSDQDMTRIEQSLD